MPEINWMEGEELNPDKGITNDWFVKNYYAQKGESVQKPLFREEKWLFLQRTVVQCVTWYVTMPNGEENGAKIKAMLLALNVMLLAVEVMLLHPKSNASAEGRGWIVKNYPKFAYIKLK